MFGKHRLYPWDEQDTLYYSLMTSLRDIGCIQSKVSKCALSL